MFLVENGRGRQLPEAVSGSKRTNYKEKRAERPGGYNVQCRSKEESLSEFRETAFCGDD